MTPVKLDPGRSPGHSTAIRTLFEERRRIGDRRKQIIAVDRERRVRWDNRADDREAIRQAAHKANIQALKDFEARTGNPF